MLLLLLAHSGKVAIQIVEPALPLPPKRLQPVGDVFESDRHQLAWSSLRISPAFDKARILQHPEMLRDCWLAELEWRHEFRHRCLAHEKTRQDCAPRWVS